jgi:mRNA interferase RelE/StbE
MYELLLSKQAEKDLKRLPPEIFRRIIRELRGLADVPRPPGCRKLSGSERDYRIRIGDYRVLYEILDDLRQVKVYRVGHRRDVYRSTEH